jgi:hypothetical protein
MASSALRQIKIEELALAQSKAKVELRIFVGGPYLDRTLPDVPPPDAMAGATFLRYSICNYIENIGQTVTVGESAQLQAAYSGALDALYEASTFEMMHVKDHCDGVVIIPSSAGSFLELGYFSADDEVCAKMLVLRNADYLSTPGYLHYGPSVQAKLSHAQIEDVDYKDIPKVLNLVSSFMNGITVKKMRNRVRIK